MKNNISKWMIRLYDVMVNKSIIYIIIGPNNKFIESGKRD